jgi:hypothetical protein
MARARPCQTAEKGQPSAPSGTGRAGEETGEGVVVAARLRRVGHLAAGQRQRRSFRLLGHGHLCPQIGHRLRAVRCLVSIRELAQTRTAAPLRAGAPPLRGKLVPWLERNEREAGRYAAHLVRLRLGRGGRRRRQAGHASLTACAQHAVRICGQSRVGSAGNQNIKTLHRAATHSRLAQC